MPEVPNSLPPGYAVNEYRIDALLGAGGFGLTYLATDANLNLKVALKEYLPGEFASREGDNSVRPKSVSTQESFTWGLKRFMDEARTLASFRHPNIVRVMRFFEANATGYMVMEYVEGKGLDQWIASRRPVPRATLLAMAHLLLDGLEVIHQSGYLHRDIKPGNIYIRGDGSPVLLDFGSARLLTGGNQELTAIISPGYAPFEQYHAHGKQGPWSDLYALGGVLYWMVTGQKPVDAASRVREDILSPAGKVGDAATHGAELLAAIDWALKPNEGERPQSVAELRRALPAVGPGVAADRTMPVNDANAPTMVVRPADSSGFTGIVLDREQLKRVEAELSRHVGPIAAVVVRNAAKKAVSIAALVDAVAREIESDADRRAFVKKFGGGDSTSRPAEPSVRELSVSEKFSADVLQRAERALAQHIGAIAKVVVKRAAAKARDEAELYLLIADEIRDPAEKKAFVRKAISISGH
jgi:serine/threonine protein kinase